MQFKFHTRKEHHFINKQIKKKNNSNRKSTNLALNLDH